MLERMQSYTSLILPNVLLYHKCDKMTIKSDKLMICKYILRLTLTYLHIICQVDKIRYGKNTKQTFKNLFPFLTRTVFSLWRAHNFSIPNPDLEMMTKKWNICRIAKYFHWIRKSSCNNSKIIAESHTRQIKFIFISSVAINSQMLHALNFIALSPMNLI